MTDTRFLVGLSWLVVAVWISCVSSLPDEPLEIPEGPVIGLVPIYLTRIEARDIGFDTTAFDDRFRAGQEFVVFDTFALAVDTLIGIYTGTLDSNDWFMPQALFRVPGITRLAIDATPQISFDNAGDLVVGRFASPDSFELETRLAGLADLPQASPREQDVFRARELTQPDNIVSEFYFECFDDSRGFLGGWEVGTVAGSPCLTNLQL